MSKELCWTDGKVWVDALTKLVDVHWQFPGENVELAVEEKAEAARISILELVDAALNKGAEEVSKQAARGKVLGESISERYKPRWAAFLDLFNDLLCGLGVIESLRPNIFKLAGLLKELELHTLEQKKLKAIVDLCDAKIYFLALDVQEDKDHLVEIREAAAKIMERGSSSSSPLVIAQVDQYLEELQDLSCHDESGFDDWLSASKWFMKELKKYSVASEGIEISAIPEASSPARVLGSGAYGYVVATVYNRQAAVKKVVRDFPNSCKAELLQDFTREFKIWSALSRENACPNIVQLFGVGLNTSPHRFAFIAEEASGDLRDELTETRIRDLGYVKKVSKDIIRGLKFMHGKNFVHLDLKPENILIFRSKGSMTAKLADFGLARDMNGSSFRYTEECAGTTMYKAPEVMIGALASAACDIFAFGVVLYELVETSFDQMFENGFYYFCESGLLYTRVDLSSSVKKLIDKCVQKKCSQRPSAAKVLQKLGRMRLAKRLPAKLFDKLAKQVPPTGFNPFTDDEESGSEEDAGEDAGEDSGEDSEAYSEDETDSYVSRDGSIGRYLPDGQQRELERFIERITVN